jgi:hypothetical protein
MLVGKVRERRSEQGVLEAFMQEYDLSSEEGVILMCLAEALLRIPDAETAEKLIADKLGDGIRISAKSGRAGQCLDLGLMSPARYTEKTPPTSAPRWGVDQPVEPHGGIISVGDAHRVSVRDGDDPRSFERSAERQPLPVFL